MITYETEIEVERDGKEILVTVTGLIDPYRAGKTYGSPDTCYPPEGGYAELSDATFNGSPFKLTADEQVMAEQQLYEQWECGT